LSSVHHKHPDTGWLTGFIASLNSTHVTNIMTYPKKQNKRKLKKKKKTKAPQQKVLN